MLPAAQFESLRERTIGDGSVRASMYPYSSTISATELRRLLHESRLVDADALARLTQRFQEEMPPPDHQNVRAWAGWLVERRVVSEFQINVLLSGRSGPFFFGPYQIVDRVRGGRFKGFFKGRHQPSGHPVLLRFVPKSFSMRRWSDLATVLPCIDSVHVLRCHEAYEGRPHRFFVLERVDGRSLRERLQQEGPLSPGSACRILADSARGLAALHAAGRVHGDIRAHNIWCGSDGIARVLLDSMSDGKPFNFARWEEAGDLLERADYMAPEFTQPGHAPTPLTDVYALGCVLFEALTGAPPFPGGDLKSKLQRHAKQPIENLADRGIPDDVCRIVAYMMAKNPPVRIQSLADLIGQLEVIAPARTAEIPPPPPTWNPFLAEIRQRGPATGPTPPPAAVSGAAGANGEPADHLPPANSPPTAIPAHRPPRRKLPRRRQNRRWIATIAATAIATAFLGGLVAILGFWSVDRPDDHSSVAKGPDTVANVVPNGRRTVEENAPEGDAPSRVHLVEDNGRVPWASPTSGGPLDVRFGPPGTEVVVTARPAHLLAQPQGQRILDVLGPDFAAARARWESAMSLGLNEVDHMTICLFHRNSTTMDAIWAVRMIDGLDHQQLLARWGDPAPSSFGEHVFTRGSWACYLSADDERTVVMGTWGPELEDVVSGNNKAPRLRHGLATLLDAVDQDRHFAIVASPNQLTIGDSPLLPGSFRSLRTPLIWLLGTGVDSACLSFHVDQAFYAELLVYHDVVTPPDQLMEQVAERLDRLPDEIESFVAQSDPSPYWRRVAFRVPSMLRELRFNLRYGVEEPLVVFNAVLPPAAGHNLIFIAQMLMEPPTGTPASPALPTTAPVPETLAELLASPLSLHFEQDSLEFALQNLAAEVKATYPKLPFPFEIQILGDDLQLAGITRNQQIRDFSATDQPLSDILTAIVRKANPITTVTDPAEEDQKLVWVVGPDPDEPSRSVVLITTRDGAREKYPLPNVFQTRN